MKKSELYDINAESTVLATLVFHPDYSISSEKLLPEYFHDKFNMAIYYGISELYKNKIKNIDFASLDIPIKKKYGSDVLNQAQCSDFLDMANELARGSLQEYMMFVNRIITSAYKRELIRKTDEIQRECLKDKSEILDVQEKMRDLTMQLTEKFSVGEDDKVFGEAIQEMWEESRKRLLDNGGIVGIPSKFTKLNDYCPFEPGEMILISAKRKEGKSTYCMNEALDKIEKGHKVLYLDTELRSSLFMERIISLKAKVDNRNLKSNNLGKEEKERISDAIGWFKDNKNFIHIYRPRWSTEMIYSAVLYWVQKVGIDFVVFDYMKSKGENASEGYFGLGNLCDFLKNEIAGGFNLCLLAAAQLNRNLDISDSYKLEMYASTIINLIKKTPKEVEYDDSLGYGKLGTHKIFIKANRSGECFDDVRSEYVDMNFVGNHFDMQDIPNSPVYHPVVTPYDK